MRYYIRIFLKEIPLEENPHIVPHLKALISGQKFWGGQSCGRSLSLGNTLLKISILLHKVASDWFHLILAVYEFTITTGCPEPILHF